MAINAARFYQNNAAQTASPAKLTLMLYDGAVKFCNVAKEGLGEGDIQKTNTNLIKVQNIITELRSTLDSRYEVAKDFEVVYDYIYRKLVEANVRKDAEPLEEALKYIREMRDTWVEVMRRNNAV